MADGPTIIRLVEGGTASLDPPSERVKTALPGSLPPSPSGVVWFGDAPGARAVADVWIAKAVLAGWSWVFVLAGRSAAAGAGLPATELAVASIDPTGFAAIELETDDPLALVSAGALCRALAALDASDGPAYDDLAFLELDRMLARGAADQVEAVALGLPCRRERVDAIRARMAEAARQLGDLERAAAYAEGAEPMPPLAGADPDGWLAAGHISRAAHHLLWTEGCTAAVAFLPRRAELSLLLEADVAARDGDLDRLRTCLEGCAALQVGEGPASVLWAVLAAVLAAAESRPGRLRALVRRVRSSQRMPASAWVRAGAPLPPLSDQWCASTLLRFLARIQVDVREPPRLPPRPIHLGDYLLEAPLAEGGMAVVWRGVHRLTGHPVAVKIVKGLDPKQIDLFHREVDLLARLDHPAIVSVLDILPAEETARAGLGSGAPALVMERIEGGTLADLADGLGYREIQVGLLAVLDGLAYAHAQGVVHRDLKPQNLLVSLPSTLRIVDFGLAGLEDGIAGTPQFMAPEQFQRGVPGPRADLYALGCVAWALVCGSPPFSGTPTELAHHHGYGSLPPFTPRVAVPTGFEAWLRRCLAKAPRDRFPSASECAAALPEPGETGIGTSTPLARTDDTFVLESLLDLPEQPSSFETTAEQTRQVHELFEDRASERARLPTPMLFHHGDHRPIWHRDVLERLWGLLMKAMGGRRTAVSLVGEGAPAVLEWLRRRAHISGLRPAAEPVPGTLSLVGMDADAPMPEGRRERWLLVWPCERDDTIRVELPRLGAAELWWVLRSRLPVHASVAAAAAHRSLGSRDVALAMLEGWMENPGLDVDGAELELSAASEPVVPAAQRVWARKLADWSRPQRELAEFLAVQVARCPGAVLDRVSDDARSRVPQVATALNDAWQMPDDLRAAVLASLTEARIRALHEKAHHLHDSPARKAIHAALAAPSEATVAAMAAAVLKVDARRKVWDALERLLNRFLMPAERARWVLHLRRLPTAEIRRLAEEAPDWRADRACLMLTARDGWTPPLLERASRRLGTATFSPLREELVAVLAREWSALGGSAKAAALLDVAESRWSGALDYRGDWIPWARARTVVGEEAVRLALEALPRASPGLRASLRIDIADALLTAGDAAGALVHLDASRGQVSIAAVYNRIVALLALRRDAEAAAELTDILPVVLKRTFDGSPIRGLVVAGLFVLYGRWPVTAWTSLAAAATETRIEPVLARVLRERLGEAPASTEIAAIARLVG